MFAVTEGCKMLSELVAKLVEFEDLSEEEAEQAMAAMMGGRASDVEISAFLVALRMKGETATEISAFARKMRELAVRISPKVEKLVDVCGTGGDAVKTFNISTTAMFVVACEVPVAKHGNRSVTSKCGSADVLEELGARLDLPPQKIEESIERIGIGFMFAPNFHPAMKNVMPVRRALRIRTVFNILGPLTNPAGAKSQLMGVFSPELTEKIAKVFKLLNADRAMVVHGEPGLDELSTLGKTKISELKNGEVRTYYVRPEDLGLKPASTKDVLGGSSAENARILRGVLNCEESDARIEIVALNAAAALVVGGVADRLSEGLEHAMEILESGRGAKKLEEFLEFSRF
ncbi:MAG: Anthranilate phosphoribosyltransferase [Candidatus Alkanophagales archaeon MCA70_species_1]|nr:Anthranilate phosphoribosyltransferase [Candidatus Alkanophaga volatiphilum]